MRKRISQEEQIERIHWEGLVRTIIDTIGPEQLADVIEYVVAEMHAEAMRLHNFAVESRRAEH